jgi:hypothetical protein
MDKGFKDWPIIAKDQDLKNIRGTEYNADLMNSYKGSQWSPLRQKPEASCNNATSRELRRIPPPAGAGGFQASRDWFELQGK